MFTSLNDFCIRHFQELLEDDTNMSKDPQKQGEYCIVNYVGCVFVVVFLNASLMLH